MAEAKAPWFFEDAAVLAQRARSEGARPGKGASWRAGAGG